MLSFSIAFIAPDEKGSLIHKVVDADDEQSAMKLFFAEKAVKYYSNDDQGFYYFKEDFSHPKEPAGSIIKIGS